MTRVEWGRLEGGDVEALLGILLCRRHPTTANRRRPASGDGGIDLYVRDGDEWDVYQVKGFTEPSLSSAQWKQIEKSWSTFREFAAANGLKVRSWHLVRPQNPTAPEEAKLATMVGTPGFPCSIRGLDFCDGLAAEFEDVIEYYLGDGSGRLERVVSQLLQALAGTEEGAELSPAVVQERMSAAVLAVNDVDPHFAYHFGVSAGRHKAMPPPPDVGQALVASATSTTDSATVTVHIFEKYLGAQEDRPVPVQWTPRIEPGTDAGREWEDFLQFGMPVKNLEVEDLSVDLPGGLGAADVGPATVSVGPARFTDEQPKDLTLTVLDEASNPVASVDLETEFVTSGALGPGKAVKAADSTGVMTILLKMTPDGAVKFNVSANFRMTGKVPAEVLPALEVLAALMPPNSFVLSIKHGIQIGDPHPLPTAEAMAEQAEVFRRTCRALAIIQTKSAQHVLVPDLEEYFDAEADGWAEAAYLIDKGRIETTWTDFTATLETSEAFDPPVDLTEGTDLKFVQPLVVSIGGEEVQAGWVSQYCESARLASDYEPGSEIVRFVPAATDRMVTQWLDRSEEPVEDEAP